MKKLIPIFIIISLVLSGLGATAFSTNDTTENQFIKKLETQKITTPELIIDETNEGFISLSLEDTSTFIMRNGKPKLPKIVKTFELPFGANNIEISVTPNKIREDQITNQIQMSNPLLPLNNQEVQFELEKIESFHSNELYPSSWFDYNIGCGLNSEFERVTFVSVHIYPIRYNAEINELNIAEEAEIEISYDKPKSNIFPLSSDYDLVIIAPEKFSDDLQTLVEHKNSFGISTLLKTTENIYNEYPGRDKPEQIKYFIKDAIESYGIKYVLLVGGLNSLIWAKPRDDNNQGSTDWHVPVRYTNLFDNPKFPLNSESDLHDPGVLCDLYYADIYGEGGVFEDWDPNGDDVFAAWGRPGFENDTGLDLIPDVSLGRLACRNNKEVRTVVEKIINYEKEPCDSSWFEKTTVISGDGFLDQEDLNILWDTNGLPDGEYIIYAQGTNNDKKSGSLDIINITLDKNAETSITFNHDDHLRISSYPSDPIVEIVSISEGNILGNSDYSYTPDEGEAYNNDFNPWANISYEEEILTIRGKSYDPKPYGNITHVHVWIENSDKEVIFSDWRNNTEMYYEGEWTTGENALFGRGGALYYMPSGYDKELIWTSNGELTGISDVINAWNEGAGFIFISGHGSPNVWADHYPGVPGNRAHGSVTGLAVTQIKPWYPFIGFPLFPMNKLSNKEKLPVTVIGGCHNSQFNVSSIPAFLDILPYYFKFAKNRYLWTHGQPVPECFSWYLVKLKNGGSIATMGNTGLGYGMPGKECTTGGGDSWITIEFFKQYGADGHDILGEAHSQAITSYVNTFEMNDLEAGHTKTVQQWVLLGDPSLKIGGYS